MQNLIIIAYFVGFLVIPYLLSYGLSRVIFKKKVRRLKRLLYVLIIHVLVGVLALSVMAMYGENTSFTFGNFSPELSMIISLPIWQFAALGILFSV